MVRIFAAIAIVALVLGLGIAQFTAEVMPGVLLSLSPDPLGGLPIDVVSFAGSGGHK